MTSVVQFTKSQKPHKIIFDIHGHVNEDSTSLLYMLCYLPDNY